MSTKGKDGVHLGFLTAIDFSGKGYVGGLLVTTHTSRPLEFQCTTPVCPNPTQKILYGHTLKPYVFGELIGQTLIKRSEVKPKFIMVDQPEMLDLRRHLSLPVALCESEQSDAEAIAFGQQWLTFHSEFDNDKHDFQSISRLFTEAVDFIEPFERVREALNETIRAAA